MGIQVDVPDLVNFGIMHRGSIKLLLSIVALLLVSPLTYAQNKSRGYFNDQERFFYGGLAVGANFCQVDGDGYSGYHKVGLNAGGLVYVRLLKRLLTSVEIIYTQKGSRNVKVYDNYYTGTAIDKYSIDLNYAEVPLCFHYILNDKWHANFGASYAQLIKSKEEVFGPQQTYLNQSLYPFRKRDFNMILGGTWQIGDGLFLDGKYQYSLNTIREFYNIPPGLGGGAQYNNLFTLRVMYLIK